MTELFWAVGMLVYAVLAVIALMGRILRDHGLATRGAYAVFE